MSVRRPGRGARLDALAARPATWHRTVVALVLAALVALSAGAWALGCAKPQRGVIHVVQPGENLYRIGLRYGVDDELIAEANGIRDVTQIKPGTRLFIPGLMRKPAGDVAASEPPRSADRGDVKREARRETRQVGSLEFAWPVDGKLTSRFGRRWGRPHEGIDLSARPGTPILAAEAGKVVHAGWLGDYGRVVIIKHLGDYRTVYAHARTLYVKKGAFVERGDRIAEVGSTGNATGPNLHFEIRKREKATDPLLYLP